jgi:hypothetical protein
MKSALKAHMMKGKGAHPDAAAKGMKKGGVTTGEMRKVGRNLARASNQRSK